MSIDTKIDKAYELVKGSPYDKDRDFVKTFGLFKFLSKEFDPSKVYDVRSDAKLNEIYLICANDKISSINCSKVPEFKNKDFLIEWVKEKLDFWEKDIELKLFKELPRSKLRGKSF